MRSIVVNLTARGRKGCGVDNEGGHVTPTMLLCPTVISINAGKKISLQLHDQN